MKERIEIIRVIDGPYEDDGGVYLVCMTPLGVEEIYVEDYNEAYEVITFLSSSPRNFIMELDE
jgi:hypothetical protein